MIRALLLLMITLPFGALGAVNHTQLEYLLGKEAFNIERMEVSSGRLDNTQDQYHLANALGKDGVLLLYVIREEPNGFAEIIYKIDIGSAGSRPSWESEIRRKSAFVSVNASGGCCSHSGITYQFKLDNKKQLVMIGYEDLSISSSDDENFHEDRLSLNLITGDAITTHLESKKTEPWTENAKFSPSWRMFKLLPPITTKTHKFRIKLDRQWTIQDLSFGNLDYVEWLSSKIHGNKK